MEPLTLVTGAPGHGKTLYAVDVLRKAKSEGLRTFHYGVKDLSPDVAEPLDDMKRWFELPSGSVLVVDECQEGDRFPKRPAHQPPPEWIEKISKVRHFGIRIVLVTQDPRNMDHFVRRLIGVHYHVTRKTGQQWALVHEFRPYADDPRNRQAQKTAQHRIWKYPKDVYALYTSATKHMVKPKVPWKVWALPVLVVLTLIAGWYGVKSIMAIGNHGESDAPALAEPASAVAPGAWPPMVAGPGPGNVERDAWASAEEFATAHTPLLRGVPWSAPVFRQLPVTAVPELYCVVVGELGAQGSRCRCFSEQMTRIDIQFSDCMEAVTRGVYNPYRSVRAGWAGSQQGGASERSASDAAAPSAGAAQGQGGSADRWSHAAPPPVQAFQGIR